jgi:hypothetical protein
MCRPDAYKCDRVETGISKLRGFQTNLLSTSKTFSSTAVSAVAGLRFPTSEGLGGASVVRAKKDPGNGKTTFALRSPSGLEPSAADCHPDGRTRDRTDSFGSCLGTLRSSPMRSVAGCATAVAVSLGILGLLRRGSGSRIECWLGSTEPVRTNYTIQIGMINYIVEFRAFAFRLSTGREPLKQHAAATSCARLLGPSSRRQYEGCA